MSSLESLAARFRDAASRGRDVVDVGPFRAYFSRDSNEYLQSVAVPIARDADWRAALPALRREFERRGRRMRLEYFAESAPGLESAVEVEMRSPVMIVTSATLRPAPRSDLRFRRLVAGDPLLDAFLRSQAEAYGVADVWRAWYERGLADGSLLVGVLLDGDAVACGATIQPGGELAGVGTPSRYRRRGFAADLCGRLVAEAFARGDDLCWLSAGDMGLGLYRRLGFEAVGTQVNAG